MVTERNVPGTYCNDETCIDCDLCREIAPHIFTRDDEEGASYVRRQPVTPDEIAEAEEALATCPSESRFFVLSVTFCSNSVFRIKPRIHTNGHEFRSIPSASI